MDDTINKADSLASSTRRYDIDWLRVIAIGILLFYHVCIVFQPWAAKIAFIQNEESWETIWWVAALFNVWRIPLLFFVSGMGVFFAMQSRNYPELLSERSRRILVPLLFGMAVITPTCLFLFQAYYDMDLFYLPIPFHLWFLGNIYIYVLTLVPLLHYLHAHFEGRIATALKQVMSSPVGMYLLLIPFALESHWLDPDVYVFYAMNMHGFWIGMLAFLSGFLILLLGQSFYDALVRHRYLNLALAFALYLVRLLYFELEPPHILSSTESVLWILAVLGLARHHLNRPGKLLAHLSQAAYPVYILHMSFLSLSAYYILPLGIPVPVKFLLIVAATFLESYLCYRWVIERVPLLRVMFGLSWARGG